MYVIDVYLMDIYYNLFLVIKLAFLFWVTHRDMSDN